MTPRYKLQTKMFVEPTLYEEGTVLDYEGEPHLGMEPLNKEAEIRLDAYLKKNPGVRLNPVDALPKTVASAIAVPPEVPTVPRATAKG